MEATKFLFDDSPETIKFAAKKCSQHNDLLDDMINLSFSNVPIYSELASKVLSVVYRQRKVSNSALLSRLIDNYSAIENDDVRMSLMNIFLENCIDLDDKSFIVLSQHCFRELDRQRQNEELKLLCLEVLKNLSAFDDDLKSELFWLTHEISFLGSGAVKQKSEDIIKGLYQLETE